MGLDKAWLPWGDGWALARIGEALAERCDSILLVKRPGQALPPTPKTWRIADDDEPGAGPLASLASAYRVLDGTCDACVLVTCDQSPESIGAAIEALRAIPPAEIRLLIDGDRRQPFPGIYAITALRTAVELRRSGASSMREMLASYEGRIATSPPPCALTDWDDPAAYLEAAREAGFEPPAWSRGTSAGYRVDGEKT